MEIFTMNNDILPFSLKEIESFIKSYHTDNFNPNSASIYQNITNASEFVIKNYKIGRGKVINYENQYFIINRKTTEYYNFQAKQFDYNLNSTTVSLYYTNDIFSCFQIVKNTITQK